MNDIELMLALTAPTAKGGGPPPTPVGPPAKVTMTSVEVTLDIAKKRTALGIDPPLLSADEKLKQGRSLRVQDTGLNSSRAMLIIQKSKPTDFKGQLSLVRRNVKGQVKLFGTADEIPKTGQAVLADPFVVENTSIPPTGLKLWVEGLTKSSAERDTGFELGVVGVEPIADRVLMTVMPNIKIKGKLYWNRTWEYNTAPKLPATAPIAAVKEFLPGAKLEFYSQKPGQTTLSLFKTVFLTDGAKATDPHGEFEITDIPETPKAALRILLEYRGGKVVTVQGNSNAVNDPDFEVKTGKVIWHQFDLDVSKWDEKTVDFDFKEMEIKKAHLLDICDMYKTIWFGHQRLLELTGRDFALCDVRYPEPPSGTSHQSGVQLFILKNDLRDRDVLLHEYGHFVSEQVGMMPAHPGYLYNDNPSHGKDSHEHYEAAWIEGPATFLSCRAPR